MAHRVTFRPGADEDLDRLYAYIRDQSSPGVAIGYIRRIREACAGLADFPERGTRRDDIAPGLRTARVARQFVDGTEALRILDQRYDLPPKFDDDLYGRPSDLVTVVVICAALLRLDEAVDSSLILIDHTPMNVFAPESINELGVVDPVAGKNIGLNIGHGVWQCVDIRREWNASILPLLASTTPDTLDNESAALLSALTLRDRVPWFIIAGLPWSGETTFTRIRPV